MKDAFHVSLLLLLLLLGQGCSRSGLLPSVSMKIGDKTFDIEIARTDAEQEKGLMERDSMPDDHGMIFVFRDEQVRAFWMYHTGFPLDIIFLDTSGSIVSIHQMIAYDEQKTSSDGPARYAIELNKGAASAAGVKVGDHIVIPPDASAKP